MEENEKFATYKEFGKMLREGVFDFITDSKHHTERGF